mmetsp:Transcript_136949/g.255775  ORF Transcript_136949/g.255775 Transcript_136949/m.255775 type:complete len:242 (-) Transcript_136949:555-1280(-)
MLGQISPEHHLLARAACRYDVEARHGRSDTADERRRDHVSWEEDYDCACTLGMGSRCDTVSASELGQRPMVGRGVLMRRWRCPQIVLFQPRIFRIPSGAYKQPETSNAVDDHGKHDHYPEDVDNESQLLRAKPEVDLGHEAALRGAACKANYPYGSDKPECFHKSVGLQGVHIVKQLKPLKDNYNYVKEKPCRDIATCNRLDMVLYFAIILDVGGEKTSNNIKCPKDPRIPRHKPHHPSHR